MERSSHSWEVDPHELSAGIEGFYGSVRAENIYPVGAALGPDGHLVLTFDGRNMWPYQVGIAKLSADGHVIWKRFDHAHHWIDIDAAGRIFAPSMEIRKNVDFAGNTAVDIKCSGVLASIVLRGYTDLRRGRVGAARSMAHGEPDLSLAIRGSSTDCGTAATRSTSIQSRSSTPRSLRTFPVWRPATFSFQFASPRPSPSLIQWTGRSNNSSLVLPQRSTGHNSCRTAPSLSSITVGVIVQPAGHEFVRIDMVTGATSTIFPRRADGPGLPFFAYDGGHLAVSPDGRRIMVATKSQSRTMEIDVESGKVLWVMETGFDISPYLAQRPGVSAKAPRGWFNVLWRVLPERHRRHPLTVQLASSFAGADLKGLPAMPKRLFLLVLAAVLVAVRRAKEYVALY